MKYGDKIKWTHEHYLNRRTFITVTKRGFYIGPIKHTARYGGKQLALVQFEGNKRTSRVPVSELICENNS